MRNGSKHEGGGAAEPTITVPSAATKFCHVQQSRASLNVKALDESNHYKSVRFLGFARNDKNRIQRTIGAFPKMIDNLFNSFTCHAVLGTALGFSTRY
jgi:hypothetical protein